MQRYVGLGVLCFMLAIATMANGQTFVRGNVNGDGSVDISDAVAILDNLFGGGPAFECDSAADVNDDGTIDISDPVYLLAFLFASGATIPQPYPAAGVDPTPDDLTCGPTPVDVVTITSAQYIDNSSPVRLRVLGTSTSEVTISDTESGYVFGTAMPQPGGQYQFLQTSPLFAPCEVQATAGTAVATHTVTGFPTTSCGPPDNFPPTCTILAPPTPITPGVPVEFSAIIDDFEGGELFYSWHFGGADDTRIQGTDMSGAVITTTTMWSAGSQGFRVNLTVEDEGGLRYTDWITVLVGSYPAVDGHPPVSQQPLPGNPSQQAYVVLAANDLGMHCADTRSVPYSILPPFNVFNAQVIERGDPPIMIDDSQVNVVYSAASNPDDPVIANPSFEPLSINSTSQNYPVGTPADLATIGKSDTWDPFGALTVIQAIFGIALPPDQGLPTVHNPGGVGRLMPGIVNPYFVNEPQSFGMYRTDAGWFTAEGVPMTSIDDFGRKNAYPLMRIQAHDNGTGSVLAALDTVIPVSQEVDCRNCHRLGEIAADVAARPSVMFEPGVPGNPIADEGAAKLNILRLHDSLHGTTLEDSQPILCASCHNSFALEDATGGGLAGDPTVGNMSAVMHSHHGQLTIDSATGELVRDAGGDPILMVSPGAGQERLIPTDPTDLTITMEQNCFTCHPGKSTQCFRGAMFDAGLKCSNCHGDMLATGAAFFGDFDHNGIFRQRLPWRDEPRCESCHRGDAVSPGATVATLVYQPSDPAAVPILATNPRFAENPGELYRNSHGHGDVMCEGCHGSTHAIWPNPDPRSNDNVAAMQLQGYAGTLLDCFACHDQNSWPSGTMNGPHGMHPVNDPNWIKSSGWDHADFAEEGSGDTCAPCHGSDHKGTRLSVTPVDRELRDDEGDLRVVVKAGQTISCDLCHSLSTSFED